MTNRPGTPAVAPNPSAGMLIPELFELFESEPSETFRAAPRRGTRGGLDPASVSPEFLAFAQRLYDWLWSYSTRPATRRRIDVVKAHPRRRSASQLAVAAAVRAGLMRRGPNGRFIRLDPRFRAQLRKSILKAKAAARPKKGDLARARREAFRMIP